MRFIDLKPSELTNRTVLFDKLVNNLTSCQTPNHISQSTTTLINDTTKCRMQNKPLEPLQWFTFMYIHTVWYKSIHNFHLLRLLSMFHFCYSGASSHFSWNFAYFFKTLFPPCFHFLHLYSSELFYHSHVHERESYFLYVKGYFAISCWDVIEFYFLLFIMLVKYVDVVTLIVCVGVHY